MTGRRKTSRGARSSSKRGSRVTSRRILDRIQDSLSLNLLHRDYAFGQEQLFNATLGHCYVATEAAFYLFGRDGGYVPYVYNHGKGRDTHWWLKNEETGDVIDPTEPQLGGGPFDYDAGHRQSFMTSTPSKRARELIRRVRVAW